MCRNKAAIPNHLVPAWVCILLLLGCSAQEDNPFAILVKDKQTIPLSSFQCTDHKQELLRECTFHNLIVWRRKIWYIAENPEDVTIPRIDMDVWPSGSQPFQVHVVSAYTAPFQWKQLQVRRLDKTVLFNRNTHFKTGNYYHNFAEHIPHIHYKACRWFGLCDYPPDPQLALIFTERLEVPWGATAVMEAYKCVTPRIIPLHGSRAFHNVMEGAYLLVDAVVGVGDACRAYHGCAQAGGKFDHLQLPKQRHRPLIPQQYMAGWRSRIFKCVGLEQRLQEDGLRAVLPLNVTIINRKPAQHRAILNIQEVEAAVKALPLNLNVRTVYMEGHHLRQQADLWSTTTIMIAVHGAALTNLFWMPKGAVLIEWQIYEGEPPCYKQLARDMKSFTEVHHIVLRPALRNNSVLVTEMLRQDSHFNGMKAEAQQALLQNRQCPASGHMRTVCQFKFLHKMSDHVVEVDKIAAAVQQAYQLVLGQAADPDDA